MTTVDTPLPPEHPAIVAIGQAIGIAELYGQAKNHQAFVIDQMVRALTGADYEAWRAAYEQDGLYTWDEGVAP